jgi:hypothetical protein
MDVLWISAGECDCALDVLTTTWHYDPSRLCPAWFHGWVLLGQVVPAAQNLRARAFTLQDRWSVAAAVGRGGLIRSCVVTYVLPQLGWICFPLSILIQCNFI